jgi:hypothetical protein
MSSQQRTSKKRKLAQPTVPSCPCGDIGMIILQESNTERNKGREFYSCSVCTGFMWADELEKYNGKLWIKKNNDTNREKVSNAPEILTDIMTKLECLEEKINGNEVLLRQIYAEFG